MHNLYNLKEMLIAELEEHGEQKQITRESLPEIDMLAHAAKNLCKVIDACEDERGYSERSYGRDYGASYARKRDSMGRFSREGGLGRGMSREGDMSGEDSGDMRGSYGGDTRQTVEQLRRMLNTAEDRYKGRIRELIRDMSNG